ncbi:MAG: hypothetical protein KC414_11795, partial [Romboutsia sp.]|nr:hypothetical protein [Romboutsia sp.]
DFYIQAKTVVKEEIIKTIKLQKDGGYLSNNHLNDILQNIYSLPLQDDNFKVQEYNFFNYYDIVSYKPEISKEEEIELQQLKLPVSINSFFAAIILSAHDNEIKDPKITSVLDLHNAIAQIIYYCLTTTNTTAINIPFCSKMSNIEQHNIKNIVKSYYKQQYNIINPQSIDDIKGNIQNDAIIKSLVSIIYDSPIRVFAYNGEKVFTIFPSNLFTKTKNQIPLNICHAYNFSQNNNYNAIIKDKNINPLTQMAKLLHSTNLLSNSEQYYSCNDYKIIVNETISGFDQIQIPADNNCCFNSVFIGAIASGIAIPVNIKNHLDLRWEVAKKLECLLQLSQTAYANNEEIIEAKNIINNFLPAAINDLNEHNSLIINFVEEYIEIIK